MGIGGGYRMCEGAPTPPNKWGGEGIVQKENCAAIILVVVLPIGVLGSAILE